VSFFEPPPPPEPITPEQFEVPEWYGPPEGVLGGVVPLELLLARSEKAAVVIESATVYPTGLEFVIDPGQRHASHGALLDADDFEEGRVVLKLVKSGSLLDARALSGCVGACSDM
jgi:hypothetical protein